MSEKTFFIKLDIAEAWADDMNVVGWAINCIGDQVGCDDGQTTGPVWRGSHGPGHDDIGTFEFLTSQEFHGRWENSPKTLPEVLDKIGQLSSRAHAMATDLERPMSRPSDEVIELAKILWKQRFIGPPLVLDERFTVLCEHAQQFVDAGYSRVVQ